jgi:uncharacterized Rmd1/YagE family protein
MLLSLTARSQVVGGYYDKLAEFYEQELWEDCAFKADRMLLREKYANDPEVYLYLAMSFHQIYQDTVLNQFPEYANAYKLALKNIVKAKRKDKVGEYFPANQFAIDDIIKSGIPMMLEYTSNGKYSKASSMLRSFMRLTSDETFYFYNGAISFFNYDEKNGRNVMDSVMHRVASIVDKAKSEYKPIISDGFRLYFDYLIDEYDIDSAENIVKFAEEIFPNDTVFINRSKMDFDSLRNE